MASFTNTSINGFTNTSTNDIARGHLSLENDVHYIEGAHGTLAEQPDETHYDDRHDAEDDVEKGRIKFPTTTVVSNYRGTSSGCSGANHRSSNGGRGEERVKLYGRQRELKRLRQLYNEACKRCESAARDDNKTHHNDDNENRHTNGNNNSSSNSASISGGGSVIFVSGYKGVGKTALVEEFLAQPRETRRRRARGGVAAAAADDSPLLFVRGAMCQEGEKETAVNAGDGDGSSSVHHPFLQVCEALKDVALNIWNSPPPQTTQDQQDCSNDDSSSSSSSSPSSSSTSSNSSNKSDNEEENEEDKTHLTSRMNKIKNSSTSTEQLPTKESIHDLISFICNSTNQPFVLFLDDLHQVSSTTETIMDIVSHLLLDKTSTLHNLIIIASYRSNQVHGDHPLHNLIETVENAREYNHGTSSGIVKIEVHPFPLDTNCHNLLKKSKRKPICHRL